jgi:predicted esterase
MSKLLLMTALLVSHWGAAAQPTWPDSTSCSPPLPCHDSFAPDPASHGVVHAYTSALPGQAGVAPTRLLIAIHGHGHDADKTFAAAMAAARLAGRAAQTLVVAPLFQVDENRQPDAHGRGCSSASVPRPQQGDLMWTCSSWQAGEAAQGGGPNSFAVLDALLQHLHRQWPSLQRATMVGFSAGAQLVQRYVAFAEAQAPHPMPVRYVVADPSSWLYFDPERPQPLMAGAAVDWSACGDSLSPTGPCTLSWRPTNPACSAENRWKYGTDGLPARLGRSADEARQRYGAAELRYLQGSEDTGSGRGTAFSVLDKSCAAMAQGPYRLQRGLAYAAYDRLKLSTRHPRDVGIAQGCAHDVACVLGSPAGQAALFDD